MRAQRAGDRSGYRARAVFRRFWCGSAFLRALVAGLLLTLPLPAVVRSQQSPTAPDAPLAMDLVETVEVSLVVLDVEVLDRQGRPMPGLTEDDFTVWVGTRKWPIYSLDEFCTCAAATDATADAAVSPEHVAEDHPTSPQLQEAGGPGDPTRPRFVLYFDFSHIGSGGREVARHEAGRWVDEKMQPGDEAMVVAYAHHIGVRELTPFTTSKPALRHAIDTAFSDMTIIDQWVSAAPLRQRQCRRCIQNCILDCESGSSEVMDMCISLCPRGCCAPEAMEDMYRGRKSIEFLSNFVAGLDAIPGRKALVLFTETGTLYPVRRHIVDRTSAYEMGDHLVQARELGASAVAARTALNVAVIPAQARNRDTDGDAGIGSADAREFGAFLAESTGGTYSHVGLGIGAMLTEAGRECCMYRIALRAPDQPGREIHRVRVAVRGRNLDVRYRVRFLTPQMRWLRQASGYLHQPERARDVPVTTALVPVAGRQKKWDLSAQVSFTADDLMLLPFGSRHQGRWRVGAMLTRENDGKAWEMLTDSQLAVAEPDGRRPAILHVAGLEKIEPGSYRLSAVVEDRNAGLFGAAETRLVIADSKTGVTAMGPLFLKGQAGIMKLGLPRIGEQKKGVTRVAGSGVAMVPLDLTSVSQGDKLYVASWICPQERDDDAALTSRFLRWVARDDEPRFRLPDLLPVLTTADCTRIEDLIDTTDLEPGDYTYRLVSRDRQDDGGETIDVTVGDVAAAETGELEIPTGPDLLGVDLTATFSVKPTVE